MSYTVELLIENRIVYTKVWGNYTLEELSGSASNVQELIRQGQPLVHDIIDFRLMEKYPTQIREILPLTSLFKEPNLGWVCVITDNRLVKFLSQIATGVARARFRTFTTLTEVLTFLAKYDATLPDLTHIEDTVQQDH